MTQTQTTKTEELCKKILARKAKRKKEQKRRQRTTRSRRRRDRADTKREVTLHLGLKDIMTLKWMAKAGGQTLGEVIEELVATLMPEGSDTPANLGALWESPPGRIRVDLPAEVAERLDGRHLQGHKLARGAVIELLLGRLACPKESPEDECWMGTITWHGRQTDVRCLSPTDTLERHLQRKEARMRKRLETAEEDQCEITNALDALVALKQEVEEKTVLTAIQDTRHTRYLAALERVEKAPSRGEKVDLFGWEEPTPALEQKKEEEAPRWDDLRGWVKPPRLPVVDLRQSIWE